MKTSKSVFHNESVSLKHSISSGSEKTWKKKTNKSMNEKRKQTEENVSSDSSFENLFEPPNQKKQNKKVPIPSELGEKETSCLTECPGCKGQFKRIMSHFSRRGKDCLGECSKEYVDYLKNLQRKKDEKRREKHNEKKRVKDYESFRKKGNERITMFEGLA